MLKKIFFTIIFILFGLNGFSQYWMFREVSDLRNSINIGFNGAHTTSLYLNYGRMIAPQHEVVVGIPALRSSKQPETGFFTNYRFHFNDDINTFFLGFFFNYSKIDGIVNKTQTTNGSFVSEQDYSHNTRIIAFGPNLGKRWISDAGFCFTARVGYGLCSFQSEWDETFQDQEFMDSSDELSKILGSKDIELSVGFAFNIKRE